MKEEKLIHFQQYKYAKLIDELREYPDSIEYILVHDYENRFDFQRTECVQMGDCFAQLIKVGKSYQLVSLIFFKSDWTVKQILEFLSSHRIEIFQRASGPLYIQNAHKIIDSKLFRGRPLVLFQIGKKSIVVEPNLLQEVTEFYEQYNKISHTGLAEKMLKDFSFD